MYTDMVTLQTMDTIFYEAQRQGRISFYLTTIGEEAINIATAAALSIDDHVFPQVTSTHILISTSLTIPPSSMHKHIHYRLHPFEFS